MRNLVCGVAVGIALGASTSWAASLSKAYQSKSFPPAAVIATLPEVKKHVKEYPSGYISVVEILGKIEEAPNVYTLYCAEVMKRGNDTSNDFKLFSLTLKHLDTDYWILGESLLQNP